MTDPFYSAKRRISRAKKHVRDLETEAGRFFDKKPYARVAEPDPTGSYELHKIKITEPLPESLSDLVVDAADALRSALDHACYAVAVAAKGGDPRNTHFPFGTSPAEVDYQLTKGRSKDIPNDIATILRGFKPYKGGNDALWGLNRMRIANQHKLLTSIGLKVGRGHLRTFKGSMVPGSKLRFPPEWDPEKNELVIGVFGVGVHIEYDMQLTFTIAFNEVEVFRRQQAIAVLDTLAGEVERILLAIEAESRRLGLTP